MIQTPEISSRQTLSSSTSSHHTKDNGVSKIVVTDERSQATQSVMSSSDSRDSISSNYEALQLKADVAGKEMDSHTLNCHDQQVLSEPLTSTPLQKANGVIKLQSPRFDDEKNDFMNITLVHNVPFPPPLANGNRVNSSNFHPDTNEQIVRQKSNIEQPTNESKSLPGSKNFLSNDSSGNTGHQPQQECIGPFPYIKINENAPIVIESGPQTILLTHQEPAFVTSHENIKGANITIQQTSNLASSNMSNADLAVNNSSNINNTSTDGNDPKSVARLISHESYVSTTSQNAPNQVMRRISSQSKITVTSAQPITTVSIAPGMKRAVVAQKKGRFNVLKDPIISPSQILAGATVPCQQSQVNTVVSLSGMQPLSDETIPKNITNENSHVSTDSLQHDMDGSSAIGTAVAVKLVNKNPIVPTISADPPKSAAVNSALQTHTTLSGNCLQCPAIPTQSNTVANSANIPAPSQPSVTKKGRFTVLSASQPSSNIKPPNLQSRSNPNLVERATSTQGNALAVDPNQQSTSATPTLNYAYVSDPRVGVVSQSFSDNHAIESKCQTNQAYILQQHSLPNSEIQHHHTTVITTSQHVPSNFISSDSPSAPQNLHQRQVSVKMQKGFPMPPNLAASNAISTCTSNASLQTQASSDSAQLFNSSKTNGQISNQQHFSALKGPGLSGAIPGGMGKMLHFLEQMKMEATEADKFIISLQKDMKYLRERNKELEMKYNDAERRHQEQKNAREMAEAKVKCLKKKLREMQSQSSIRETEDLLMNDHAINETSCVVPSIQTNPDSILEEKRIISPLDDYSSTNLSKGTDCGNIPPGNKRFIDNISIGKSKEEMKTVERTIDKHASVKNVGETLHPVASTDGLTAVKNETLVSCESSGSILSFKCSTVNTPISCETGCVTHDQDSSRDVKVDDSCELKTTSEILRDFDPFQPTSINTFSSDRLDSQKQYQITQNSSVVRPNGNTVHNTPLHATSGNVLQNQTTKNITSNDSKTVNGFSDQEIPILRGNDNVTFS